mgnify:CR=1 FL=1
MVDDAQGNGSSKIGLRAGLFLIFAFSGVAGLIYEAVWGRYLKLFLGHSAYAQTFVIAIFMGGMALGAGVTSKLSRRWSSLLRAYAYTELLIGVIAFTFHDLFQGATSWAFVSVIPSLESAFLISSFKHLLALSLILGPAILLGMTFPLMSGGVIRLFPHLSGSSLSMLYFTNSLGAACGVLLTGFVFVPTAGLPGTVLIAGFLNVVIGLVVLLMARGIKEPPIVEHVVEGDVYLKVRKCYITTRTIHI